MLKHALLFSLSALISQLTYWPDEEKLWSRLVFSLTHFLLGVSEQVLGSKSGPPWGHQGSVRVTCAPGWFCHFPAGSDHQRGGNLLIMWLSQ